MVQINYRVQFKGGTLQKESILKLKVLGFFLLTPFLVPATGLLYFKSDPLVKFFEKGVGKLLSYPIEIVTRKEESQVISQKEDKQLLSAEPVLVYRVQTQDDIEKLRTVLASKEAQPEKPQEEVLVATVSPHQAPSSSGVTQSEQNAPKQETRAIKEGYVSGRIVHYEKDQADRGHYEVFLYDQVGSDGLPHPRSKILRHIILSEGVSDFEFTIENKTSGYLLARYFSHRKKSVLSEPYPLKTAAVFGGNPVNGTNEYKNILLLMGQHHTKNYALTGRVLNGYPSIEPYALPLSGVEVELEGTDISLRTDPQGFFYLDDLVHFDGYLKIVREGKILKRVPLYLDTSRYLDIPVINEQEGNYLQGQILNRDGEPFKHVELRIKENTQWVSVVNAQGLFRFENIQDGFWTLEAFYGSVFLGFYRVLHREGITTEVLLQERGPIDLNGKILASSLLKNFTGNAVNEAQVRVVGQNILGLTDAEGNFHLAHISAFADYVELEIDHKDYFLANIKYKKSLDVIYLPRLLSFEEMQLPFPFNPQAGNFWADLSYLDSKFEVFNGDSSAFRFYMNDKGLDLLAPSTLDEGQHRLVFFNLKPGEQNFTLYSQDMFRGLTTSYCPPGYITLFQP